MSVKCAGCGLGIVGPGEGTFKRFVFPTPDGGLDLGSIVHPECLDAATPAQVAEWSKPLEHLRPEDIGHIP